jgi:heterodisulfide reductase subunit A-like polyferredoxin
LVLLSLLNATSCQALLTLAKEIALVNRDVLVIGGGIAGMQASLDLAEMGYQVHLVERLPTIGGKMAQLDKTFPTNDCAL